VDKRKNPHSSLQHLRIEETLNVPLVFSRFWMTGNPEGILKLAPTASRLGKLSVQSDWSAAETKKPEGNRLPAWNF
jgi:hypothetical protein